MKINNYFAQFVFTLVLVLLGVLTRTVWHIGPNIEFVTAISLAAGFFFKDFRISYVVPLLTMIITDSIIGNTNIMLFTWSAFLLIPAIGRFVSQSKINKILGTGLGGFTSIIFFYLWTNFGVVVMGNNYPHTFSGLVESYINGLPFLFLQLSGNLFAIPFVFLTMWGVSKIIKKIYKKEDLFQDKYLTR